MLCEGLQSDRLIWCVELLDTISRGYHLVMLTSPTVFLFVALAPNASPFQLSRLVSSNAWLPYKNASQEIFNPT
jgi:hypothetical protein